MAVNPTATMEELWKDISPSPLHCHDHRHSSSSPATAAARQDMIFQDFLGPPPPTSMLGHPTGGHYGGSNLSSSSVVNPPPVTILSLNTGKEFHFLESPSPFRSSSISGNLQRGGLANVSSAPFSCYPFESLDNSTPALPCFGAKKRTNDSDTGSGDRRHKKMIKNRESAARSRARKQAYTNELELEVAHLMEENARLKKQQEQLYMASAAKLPKKNAFQRSSTAPF
ncbi:hypothetical protein SAY87_029087 [Trapa incisa]|uniref:BZIP domain-containing protein n=1 Tax=Trapa incisa TaxID=236973 RepID=A0AAN7L0X8_9MYRT|nr:hypothetical protein SAY87_029087 [Trapa incisa]